MGLASFKVIFLQTCLVILVVGKLRFVFKVVHMYVGRVHRRHEPHLLLIFMNHVETEH
jgi:hypothetical protein